MVKTIKVAIVEDDNVIRNGIEYVLNNTLGFECVGSFNSGDVALKKLAIDDVDVVLMDINMPGISGIDCVRELRKRRSDLNILMLTVYETSDNIFRSLTAGASGYVLKNTPMDELLKAIIELNEGGAPMSNEIARKVIKAFQTKPAEETEELSKREYEIVSELAKGLTYEEIADKLFISIETVRFHIKNMYSKLHVHSRTQAVMKVFQQGNLNHNNL
ncbi:MAG: response regulator transcription factor [Bacteroidota bacterium]|nr:response regulator transcription factor [Bacteroidota bacterium]